MLPILKHLILDIKAKHMISLGTNFETSNVDMSVGYHCYLNCMRISAGSILKCSGNIAKKCKLPKCSLLNNTMSQNAGAINETQT